MHLDQIKCCNKSRQGCAVVAFYVINKTNITVESLCGASFRSLGSVIGSHNVIWTAVSTSGTWQVCGESHTSAIPQGIPLKMKGKRCSTWFGADTALSFLWEVAWLQLSPKNEKGWATKNVPFLSEMWPHMREAPLYPSDVISGAGNGGWPLPRPP